MGLRIKEILKEQGGTSLSLAEKVGITRPNMSNIVNGKTKPSLDTLERIATALNVEIWELFERTGTTELNAFVEYKEEIYKATTIKELEGVIADIKKQLREPGESKQDTSAQKRATPTPGYKEFNAWLENEAPLCYATYNALTKEEFDSIKELGDLDSIKELIQLREASNDVNTAYNSLDYAIISWMKEKGMI